MNFFFKKVGKRDRCFYVYSHLKDYKFCLENIVILYGNIVILSEITCNLEGVPILTHPHFS